MADYLKDYKKLTHNLFSDLEEDNGYVGGQADLTPLRNKAREGMDALADAMRAADMGMMDDCMESLRRAKTMIDAALGSPTGVAPPAFLTRGNGPTRP